MIADRSLPVRVLDVLVAGALLVLALPLMAVLAVGVRLSSNGDVLHREETRSATGRIYERLSFRTTLDGATSAAHAQVRAVVSGRDTPAPRTAVGRLMRVTHTDRLPRLWNVVNGDVGLFG